MLLRFLWIKLEAHGVFFLVELILLRNRVIFFKCNYLKNAIYNVARNFKIRMPKTYTDIL